MLITLFLIDRWNIIFTFSIFSVWQLHQARTMANPSMLTKRNLCPHYVESSLYNQESRQLFYKTCHYIQHSRYLQDIKRQKTNKKKRQKQQCSFYVWRSYPSMTFKGFLIQTTTNQDISSLVQIHIKLFLSQASQLNAHLGFSTVSSPVLHISATFIEVCQGSKSTWLELMSTITGPFGLLDQP